VVLLGAGVARAACPPAGETRASLQALKEAQWRAPGRDDAAGHQALGLVDCLADPDPVLRDALAFDGLQTLMRAKLVDVATLQTIRARLLSVLAGPADGAGFHQPFAALVLAEVARADRLQPFLSAEQRAQLVEQGSAYLARVRDYRGFDVHEGWRHGVAHGADLMLQLSLNPQLAQAQADTMLTAIAAQVMPAGAQFYQYGEGERLMAPVFYLARRGWWQAEDWERWLAALTARLPKDAATTQAGLAARHNLGAFVTPLYVSVQESGDPALAKLLLPGLRKALQALD
jgi:hypothetical protein